MTSAIVMSAPRFLVAGWVGAADLEGWFALFGWLALAELFDFDDLDDYRLDIETLR